MTLEEILKKLHSLDDELIIFAEKTPKWTANSKAIISYQEEFGVQEFPYFLEVGIAKEAIDVWSQWRNDRKPSIENICEATICYAENDAYLPINE